MPLVSGCNFCKLFLCWIKVITYYLLHCRQIGRQRHYYNEACLFFTNIFCYKNMCLVKFSNTQIIEFRVSIVNLILI